MSYLVPISSLAVALLALMLARFLKLSHAVVILGLVAAVAIAVLIMSESSRQATLLVGPFMLPFLAAGAVAGIGSAMLLKQQHTALAVLPFIPFLYFLWRVYSQESDEETVLKGALAFISSQPDLRLSFGPSDPRSLVSYSKGQSGNVMRLEYDVAGTSRAYAIVDVDRTGGSIKYRLACITSLYLGARDPFKDACSQGRIDIPPIK